VLRTKDISDGVAAAAYAKIASISPLNFDLPTRLELIESGFSERYYNAFINSANLTNRRQNVKKSFHVLITTWLKECDLNLVEFIKMLGFPNNEDIIEQVLRGFSASVSKCHILPELSAASLFLRRICSKDFTVAEEEVRQICSKIIKETDRDLCLQALSLFAAVGLSESSYTELASTMGMLL
jgi:hypothetical protein